MGSPFSCVDLEDRSPAWRQRHSGARTSSAPPTAPEAVKHIAEILDTKQAINGLATRKVEVAPLVADIGVWMRRALAACPARQGHGLHAPAQELVHKLARERNGLTATAWLEARNGRASPSRT